MNIYTFRISKGEPAGVIEASCPLGFKEKKSEIIHKIKKIKPTKIDYKNNGYQDYLHDELWKHNRLRQGWGVPGLDLALDEEEWIENYILAMRQYWGEPLVSFGNQSICHEASGRYKLFYETLYQAKANDIIIIPTHSEKNHHDSKHMTIATISDIYYFDVNSNYNDFGHVLPVKDLKVVPYDETIRPMSFTGYYQRAVTRIQDYYKISTPLKELLKKVYLK